MNFFQHGIPNPHMFHQHMNNRNGNNNTRNNIGMRRLLRQCRTARNCIGKRRELSKNIQQLNNNFNKQLLNIARKNNGIKLQVHYIPVHLHPFYKKSFGMNVGDFQVAEQFYQNEFSLPVYTNLSMNEFQIVTSHISQYLN